MNEAGQVIEPTYLPFTEKELSQHFVPWGSGPDAYLKYYTNSAERYRKFCNKSRQRRGHPLEDMRKDCQIEKDERIWIASCLMHYYHRGNRVQNFCRLLESCFGKVPPVPGLSTWEECLKEDGEENKLFFEVFLPTPRAYKSWLKQRVRRRQFIPYVLDAAYKRGGTELKEELEGPTRVDAVLINSRTGFAVLFEAKVLSDVSVDVTFDAMRNQIARTIDVMLEPNAALEEPLRNRNPERTLFVLLTPQMFYEAPHARLYGWLMREYRQSPAALARDLPHRQGVNWPEVARRMGWLTWETSHRVLPGACPWLDDTAGPGSSTYG